MPMSAKARMHRLFTNGGCLDVAIDHGFFNEWSFLAGIEEMAEAVRTGTSMSVAVYSPTSSTTPLLTLVGAVDTGVNHIRLGQVLSNPTVPTFTLDEVVLTDRTEALAAPSPAKTQVK